MRKDARPASWWRLLLAAAATLGSGGNALAQCCIVPVVEHNWRFGSAATDYGAPQWITGDGLGNLYLGTSRVGAAGYLASHDGGLTWDRGDFATAEGSEILRMAAAPGGPVVALYYYAPLNEFRARGSLDHSATWSAPVVVFSGLGSPPYSDVEIKMDATGLCAARVISASRTLVSVSSDSGVTWTAPAELDAGDPGTFENSLLALEDPLVVCAAAGPDRVLVRRSLDRGLNWDPVVVATGVPSWQALAGLTGSGLGHFQVAYYDASSADLRVATSSDGAATFASDAAVAPALPGTLRPPRLLVTGAGEVAVVGWNDASGLGLGHVFSGDHGLAGSWMVPGTFARLGVSIHGVRVAAGPFGSGAIYLVHDDYRYNTPPCAAGTCESIFLQHTCDAPRTWSGTELRLDADGTTSHSEEAKVFADPSGRVHVAWTDTGSGAALVYYRALDPIPDAVPPALGNVLKAVRIGRDVELHWTDLPDPAGEYQVVALDCDSDLDRVCDQLPLEPALSAAPYRSAPVGAEQLLAAGDVDRASFLVYYRVRATSACSGTPGPV